MDLRRLCVFGVGAIGGHLAARLAAAGHEVAAVARGPQLEALRERGIALRQGARSFAGRVRASSVPSDLGPQDVVFVTTKATSLAAFASAAAPLLHAHSAVVFVQNGIPWWYALGLDAARPRPPDLARLDPGGALAGAVAPGQVVGGIAYTANTVVAPGVIENGSVESNMIVIGEVDDRPTPRIAALRALLESVGIRSPAAPDVRAAVWDKVVSNFGASLCVPTGATVGELFADERLLAARARLLAEGRAVAAAHGIRLELAPPRPGGPQAVSGAARHKPSMLQDLEAGRPMEVEAILATPCAFARAAGVEAPALEQLVAVVARLAAARGLYAPA